MNIHFKPFPPKDSVHIVKNAVVLGDVEIGEGSSVLFHAVIRGDVAPIRIGKRTNVQDNCTIHVDGDAPVDIGDDVTIGHNAVVHGCTVGNGTMIGMGSTVLSRSKIGKECIIGAGSVVLEGQEIPDGYLAAGDPAKIKRKLTQEEREHLYEISGHYVELGKKLEENDLTI